MYEYVASHLNQIFEADHKLETAKIEHSNDWEDFLVRSLSESCLLFNEIEDDAVLDFVRLPQVLARCSRA